MDKKKSTNHAIPHYMAIATSNGGAYKSNTKTQFRYIWKSTAIAVHPKAAIDISGQLAIGDYFTISNADIISSSHSTLKLNNIKIGDYIIFDDTEVGTTHVDVKFVKASQPTNSYQNIFSIYN